MVNTHTSKMTTGSVVSRDGTPIGYLKIGQSPAVVILRGSMKADYLSPLTSSGPRRYATR
jgi:hypothetical protein